MWAEKERLEKVGIREETGVGPLWVRFCALIASGEKRFFDW